MKKIVLMLAALSLSGCGGAVAAAVRSSTQVKVADHPADPDTPECNDAVYLMPLNRYNDATHRNESCTCAYAGDGAYYWRSDDGKVGNAKWCPPTSAPPFAG